MKQNIKIAKELIKLAKNLLADHKHYDIEDNDSLSYLNDDYYEHEDYANRQVQQRHLYDERDDSNDEYSIDENDNWLDDGKYINFTGEFSYGDKFRPFFADVYNATFKLMNKKIFWENGIWKDGNWNDGVWKDGTWKDGTWNNGTWEKGVWKDGIWNDGTWKDGTWKRGEWYGGYDKDKNLHDEFNSPDKWEK